MNSRNYLEIPFFAITCLPLLSLIDCSPQTPFEDEKNKTGTKDDDDNSKKEVESDDDQSSNDDTQSSVTDDSESLPDEDSLDNEETSGDESETLFDTHARLQVIDEESRGVSGKDIIQFCGPIVDDEIAGVCMLGSTDDDGMAKFDNNESNNMVPGRWVAKIVPAAAFPDKMYTGNSVRVDLVDGEVVDVGAILFPEAKQMIKVDAEESSRVEVTVTDDLTLHLIPNEIEFVGSVPSQVGAASVAKELWPIASIEGKEVLYMWAFASFGVHSKVPVAISLAGSLGQPAGSKIHVYELAKDLGEFREVAEGKVDVAGEMISTGEQGLSYFTWMAMTASTE